MQPKLFRTELKAIIGSDEVKADSPWMVKNGTPAIRFHYLAGHPLCKCAQDFSRISGEPIFSLEGFRQWTTNLPGKREEDLDDFPSVRSQIAMVVLGLIVGLFLFSRGH